MSTKMYGLIPRKPGMGRVSSTAQAQAQAQDARARFQQEAYLPRVMEVLLEDLSNVKRTQRGIDSGGKDYMSSRTTR